MRFRYWTIRANPDPIQIQTFGVGVLVMDTNTGEVDTATLDRVDAIPSRTPNRDAIYSALRHLTTKFRSLGDQGATIELSDVDSASGFAYWLVGHWNNLITLDSPRHMSASPIREATMQLFDLYIGGPRADSPQRGLPRLRQTVRSVYDRVPEIRDHLVEKPGFETRLTDGEFDLAVVGDESHVFELNSSFSFTPQNFRGTRDRIEAWNYRIGTIREGGCTLNRGDATIRVPGDAPVVATFDEPTTEQQHELKEAATRQWSSLGVRAIPENQLEAHSHSLGENLLSA